MYAGDRYPYHGRFVPGDANPIGYEDLKAANPGLIYCSLSGFGRTGPYSHRRGFDLVAQAMSGIMSVTGEPDRPARCPGRS